MKNSIKEVLFEISEARKNLEKAIGRLEDANAVLGNILESESISPKNSVVMKCVQINGVKVPAIMFDGNPWVRMPKEGK